MPKCTSCSMNWTLVRDCQDQDACANCHWDSIDPSSNGIPEKTCIKNLLEIPPLPSHKKMSVFESPNCATIDISGGVAWADLACTRRPSTGCDGAQAVRPPTRSLLVRPKTQRKNAWSQCRKFRRCCLKLPALNLKGA